MSTGSIGPVSAVDLLAVAAAGLAAGTASADLLEDEPEHPAPSNVNRRAPEGEKGREPPAEEGDPGERLDQVAGQPGDERPSEIPTIRDSHSQGRRGTCRAGVSAHSPLIPEGVRPFA
jgi:hypothetical protein